MLFTKATAKETTNKNVRAEDSRHFPERKLKSSARTSLLSEN
jgi:hypothetical protein